MTNYTTETLSEALAKKLKIRVYTHTNQYEKCHLFLIDDTKRMAELAVEHGLGIEFYQQVGEVIITHNHDEIINEFYLNYPSKLHAWRWAIGLALMELK
jgi:hypothetical protein